ncbi:MAG: NAD+ synthase [Beijerinckiaceae bacterium]|jgi:NAD+ synthase|nr:NAD+ synthase [Beijerinckiaceae bacterium]
MSKTPDRLLVALAQLNPVMGDIAGNLERARQARQVAAGQGADLVLFSELFLTGYPPEDMVTKPALEQACRQALDHLARETADGGPAMLVGLPWREGGRLHNAVAALDAGRILGVRFKVDLPNYGVFDEKRVFAPGPMPGPLAVRGVRLGLPICEDIWGADVVECLAETGAEILLVPNGSPYERNKADVRTNIAVARVKESGLPLVYLNQVGGQDELVFDGASFGLQADGSLAFQFPAFVEHCAIIAFERKGGAWRIAEGEKHVVPEGPEADYAACVLGLKDYVEKNRFPGVVLGLSGGVDSAICAAMAADALGPERVHAVMLPYRYTSEESLRDARDCAQALGIRYDTLPIAPAVEGLESVLAPLFAGRPRDVTEENLQSRARGTLLMSISNKFGSMVVTTGNKSEMSVGYATLYGDMNGGYNPIKDLYKMEVFRLSALRNRWKPPGAKGPDGIVIPENILTKPPTAELRENQKDQDSLPPYEILDDILEGLVEQEMPASAIVARGHDLATVQRIEHLLSIAEYKRRQSAPGVKITRRNFGRDRRYPITNAFRDRLPGPYTPDPALAPGPAGSISEAFDG